MTHLKKIFKKNGPDLTDEQALAILKTEIVDEVRGLAAGLKISIFELVEKGKEMIELETKLKEPMKSKKELMAEF